jgi:L-alanine-DL-glutamate epimerase-like enolase superfamily enzyme
VSPVRVMARRPADVAREVERLVSAGHRAFVLVPVEHGGMLDMERLGAARYAAGSHSEVGMEEETPTAVAAAR